MHPKGCRQESNPQPLQRTYNEMKPLMLFVKLGVQNIPVRTMITVKNALCSISVLCCESVSMEMNSKQEQVYYRSLCVLGLCIDKLEEM